MDQKYTCIPKRAPVEIEFDQVKITNAIARVSLDFFKDRVKIIGIGLDSFEH